MDEREVEIRERVAREIEALRETVDDVPNRMLTLDEITKRSHARMRNLIYDQAAAVARGDRP